MAVVDNLEALPAKGTDNANKLVTRDKVDILIGTVHSGVAAAMACGVGYLRNSSGVTLFTVASVHWAESMVATRSSQASLCWRAQTALG